MGARRVGGPKFRAFFLSRQKISFFLLSLGGLLVEFWWCLKRRCAQVCTFGVLWLLCEAGVSHDNQRAPHLRVPAFKTPPKFNEKTPREGRKERILRREREKKERKFGRSRGRAVQGKGGPGEGRSHQTLKPTPTHETPLHETVKSTHATQHNTTQHNTIKVGFGQSRFRPKSVLAKVGHERH